MTYFTKKPRPTSWNKVLKHRLYNLSKSSICSAYQFSTLKLQKILDNLEGHQVIYLNLRDADQNCPVHEMEGEESQGEGDS